MLSLTWSAWAGLSWRRLGRSSSWPRLKISITKISIAENIKAKKYFGKNTSLFTYHSEDGTPLDPRTRCTRRPDSPPEQRRKDLSLFASNQIEQIKAQLGNLFHNGWGIIYLVFKASRTPAFSFPLAPAPGLAPGLGEVSPAAIEDFDKLRPGSEIL